MKNKSSATVSLGDIAREAGVSRVAVSYALRNSPGVGAATRKRILEISKKLGYVPDARMASLMSGVRDTKNKGLLPIAWLNTIEDTPTWRNHKYLSPFLEGAQERATQLGYRIDEIWTHAPGVNMASVSRMLYQRGIEGIIVTYPAGRFRIDWSHFAGVAIGGGLLAPRLHRVMADQYYNLLLALKMLKRHGYRRVGICLEQAVDRYSAHSLRAAAIYAYTTTPKSQQIPPLFYTHRNEASWPAAKAELTAWLVQHKPDVIIGHSSRLIECVEAAGYRMPQDIGVVHLATDDDVADWAGVNSNRRRIGATAVELAVSLVRNRQFGIPAIAPDTTISGTWHPGRTLLIPKPA